VQLIYATKFQRLNNSIATKGQDEERFCCSKTSFAKSFLTSFFSPSSAMAAAREVADLNTGRGRRARLLAFSSTLNYVPTSTFNGSIDAASLFHSGPGFALVHRLARIECATCQKGGFPECHTWQQK